MKLKSIKNSVHDKVVIEEDEPFQYLIVSTSGMGKTLLCERLIWNYYQKNFHILVASDQKRLLELGFMTFPPEIMKPYHKQGLKLQGEEPTSIPIKVFHPFTFDLPSKDIPETEIISFSLRNMGDEEFDFLIESTDDRTTRELLLQARDNLQKDEGLWHYMKRVEALTERKTRKEGSREVKLPDKDRFMMKGVSSGTVSNLDTIERAFHRFQKHLFLMPENHPLNLDWKEQVFDNQEEVKVFTTRYISQDKKSRDFFLLFLLNQLVEHAGESDKKILVVLDELKDAMPRKGPTYNQILAKSVASKFTTDFRARGIGSVSTSQSFSGISKTLLRENVWNKTLIMNTQSQQDLKTLRDVYGLYSHQVENILELGRNEFYTRGVQGGGVRRGASQTALFPPFPHRESGSNDFDKLWKKYYPDKMMNCKVLKKQERERVESWKQHFWEQHQAELERKEKQERELEEAKEKAYKLERKLEEKRGEEKSQAEQEREERDREIVDKYRAGDTQKELALEYDLSQPAIHQILKKRGELDG